MIYNFITLNDNKEIPASAIVDVQDIEVLIDLVPLYKLPLTEIKNQYADSVLVDDGRLKFTYGDDSLIFTSSEKQGFTYWINAKDTSSCQSPATLSRQLTRFGIDSTKLGKKSGIPTGSTKSSGSAHYCESEVYPFSIEFTCFDGVKAIVLGDKQVCLDNTD